MTTVLLYAHKHNRYSLELTWNDDAYLPPYEVSLVHDEYGWVDGYQFTENLPGELAVLVDMKKRIALGEDLISAAQTDDCF